MSNLSAPYLHNEDAAYEHLESLLWPTGPVCPHCGCTDRIVRIPVNVEKRVRHGLHRCHDCKKQFTVKVGTVFESSKVPLYKWLQAVVLMVSSKKGISSHQLHRALGVTYKTAWSMSHRIREAMRSGDLAPFGGNGGTVEADETYIGQKANPAPSAQRAGRPYKNKKRGPGDKRAVLGLVERGGHVRTFLVDQANKATVGGIVRDNVVREANLMTDESRLYTTLGTEFASHETVKRSANEYVRGVAHTNTIEGVFSIFKRGMKGVYQHCSEKHLHCYLAEFDFRYNQRAALGVDDGMRASKALEGIKGRRLTYRV